MRFLILLLIAPFLHAKKDFSADLTVTKHTMELQSGAFEYTALTGMCPIHIEQGGRADLFFISYTKTGGENRPITFVFPGGPGGAGTLEAILTFGPRRLLTADEGRTILPPYKLIDNPQTLLEYTDLVFVDPVECGFSRAGAKANLQYFFSVEGDIESLGEFIHTYIDMARRWNSPVYLSGGSYGTLRCCGLSANLFQYGIATQGIILDGCAFEWSTIQSQRDKPLPDWLLIPTFAATAWYHNRLWPEKSLAEVVDYARRFAYDDYAPYMLQPSRLSYVEKKVLEQKLSELIGLPVDTVKRYNGRLNEEIYTAEFFGSERKVLGGLDSRYAGDISTIDPNNSHDPSYLDSIGSLPAFNSYLQKELNTHFPLKKYISFSSQALYHWNFGTYDSFGEPSLLQRLRHVLIINPLMKVFVGSGYYDCRTPFAATEYNFEHLDLPESYKNNIQFEYYEAGHGFIFDYESLKKWKHDLTRFYGY
jgi:carboxypeptidase C (cathepsin A)